MLKNIKTICVHVEAVRKKYPLLPVQCNVHGCYLLLYFRGSDKKMLLVLDACCPTELARCSYVIDIVLIVLMKWHLQLVD